MEGATSRKRYFRWGKTGNAVGFWPPERLD
jgi:hypothetical protein